MKTTSIYAPRPLTPGARVKLTEDGPTLTVLRVSPGAAYVGRETVRSFEVHARGTGEAKTITKRGWDVDPISRNAFVYPGEPGEPTS